MCRLRAGVGEKRCGGKDIWECVCTQRERGQIVSELEDVLHEALAWGRGVARA